MMDGIAALKLLSRVRTEEVVITCMSNMHDWAKVTTRPELDMGWGGGMGKASSFALGLALARPKERVWLFDGDGSLLMNLGCLVTIAAMAPTNLIHFVWENDVYDTTGGQAIPGGGHIDFATLARGANYPYTFVFDNVDDLAKQIEVIKRPGPMLVVLKVRSLGRRPPDKLPKVSESFVRIKRLLAERQ